MPFSQLPEPLRNALVARGYSAPTPVQAAVIEEEARNRDLVVSARTGSGKTVAFGVAMGLQLLSEGTELPPAATPLALVIAPTRELALQVSREFEWLFAECPVRITTCVGGMDPSRERRALNHGTHIVVGTPGRLRDHLERGALDLSALRFVVLDEADEMLDMGFRDDLEEILDATPTERQTLLFSATMPKSIVALARQYQRDALRISTVGDDQGHGDIAYQAVAVTPSDIEHAVINLLRFHEAETAMLFCATRDNVRHLHATLVERGFAAVALSGEHSQNERNYALQALRDKRARVCVATDVAARGIDVASLSLVIHVEIPRDAETLQHRSGRTGRAGKKGTAVLIVPYPRRRRVEMLLRGARIDAEWVEVPTPETIRDQDRERLIATLLEPIEASDEERALAARLLDEKSPEDLALALVRAHSSRLPQPEELIDMSAQGAGGEGRGREPGHRPGFEDIVWFRMDIGRRQNADPRWILPLLCRRGHITKNEIGAIRIAANETFFQVPRTVEAKFRAALARTAVPGGEDESGITIEPSDETPRDSARSNGRGANDRPRPERSGSYVRPREDRGGDRPVRSGPRPERTFPDRDGAERPKTYRAGPNREGPNRDRPERDRPSGERTYGDRPRSDRPAGDRPAGDRPERARPERARPEGDRPVRRNQDGPARAERADGPKQPRQTLAPNAKPRGNDGGERSGKDGKRPFAGKSNFRGKPQRKVPRPR